MKQLSYLRWRSTWRDRQNLAMSHVLFEQRPMVKNPLELKLDDRIGDG